MAKLDLTKEHRAYYRAASTPELVGIVPARYLSICGNPSGKV